MKTIKNIRELSKLIKTSKKYIIYYILLSILISIVGVISPILSANQLVNVTEGIWNKVIIYSVFIFFLAIFRGLINIAFTYVTEKFSKIIVRQLQIDLAKEMLDIKIENIDKHSNGLFIQRLTGDVHSITSIFTYGIDRINSFFVDMGVFVVIFVFNMWLGIYLLVFMIIFILFSKFKNKILNKLD